MKGYPLPLSEAFVYGSPERPIAGSYRWVRRVGRCTSVRSHRRREVPHAGKR